MSVEWAMFFLTLINVVASIIICVANLKSAKASMRQVKEMKVQFEENTRPYIDVEFVLINKIFFGLKFTNNGNRIANNISINISDEFINGLEPDFKNLLQKEKGKICILGTHQSYLLIFGANNYIKKEHKEPAKGEITYCSNGKVYNNSFSIDVQNYMTIYTVNSIEDDVVSALRKQNDQLKSIICSINNLGENIKKIIEKKFH